MPSFHIFNDYQKLIQAKNQLSELKVDKNAGKVDLKTYFQQKETLENTIDKYQNAQKPSVNIHQKYQLQELLKFTFLELQINDNTDCSIEELRLFTEHYIQQPKPDTLIILDNYDDDNEEGYTSYVLDNKLELLYNGQLFIDVIQVYLDYKSEFDVNLLIKSLEYYAGYDCFMSIN